MRPCPNCECFVPMAAKRCPRCEAALEPVVVEDAPAPRALELALVGAPAGGPAPSTLPKLPQPFATDPLAIAPFLGVPVVLPETAPPTREPEPPPTPPTPATRATDELAADLSPATIAAILDAAAEITTGGVSATWSPQADAPPDAALERVIARANELAEHAPAPAPPAEAESPAASEPEASEAETTEPEDRDEPRVDPPQPPDPPASTIVATPLAAPVVLNVPEAATKPPRRKWFSRRDAFSRRFTRRERVLAKACAWLVVALAASVLALKLPVGPRPELGASTSATGGQIGTAQAPVTSPFADAIRIQTQADLQVVVAKAASVYPLFRSFQTVTPSVLAHQLPQFAFLRGAQASVRVGQMSVATTKSRIVFAEYAGPKGCAYARLVAHQNAQVVIGATGAACRATSPPASGWRALGAG